MGSSTQCNSYNNYFRSGIFKRWCHNVCQRSRGTWQECVEQKKCDDYRKCLEEVAAELKPSTPPPLINVPGSHQSDAAIGTYQGFVPGLLEKTTRASTNGDETFDRTDSINVVVPVVCAVIIVIIVVVVVTILWNNRKIRRLEERMMRSKAQTQQKEEEEKNDRVDQESEEDKTSERAIGGSPDRAEYYNLMDRYSTECDDTPVKTAVVEPLRPECHV